MDQLTRLVKESFEKVKQLEEDIGNASPKSTLSVLHDFLLFDLEPISIKLETAVTLLETKNDHGGNRDHSGTL